jgi:hypothetical protein
VAFSQFKHLNIQPDIFDPDDPLVVEKIVALEMLKETTLLNTEGKNRF